MKTIEDKLRNILVKQQGYIAENRNRLKRFRSLLDGPNTGGTLSPWGPEGIDEDAYREDLMERERL